MPRSSRRTYLLFGALTFYVLLQFLWWAVLLVRKEREMAALALQVKALGGDTDHPLDASRALRMIVGEGSVFIALLLGMLFLTFRAIRRDLAVARSQRNFLMAVTHELRTPIAAIKLQLQTLKRTGLSQEQRDGLNQQALTEADRLSVLADKVLLATSADEGVISMDLKQVQVMELMRQVADRATAQIAPKHRIELHGPDAFSALSDEQALRSIADNLIENAAKYSPVGTLIRIEITKGREGWRLSVVDEGPGIPLEEQSRIFDRFYRGGNEETRQAKGTGLGLYIVKRLVQRLGGEVQVTSATPTGSIFAASFPLR
ncbi:MAG TPA: HAMP domain-containing sensor histidine kinase [Flavobacteriales bacterium]|nr:HAMP domain-containing sensor histidine kinase [Flavobacteriales bacterium]